MKLFIFEHYDYEAYDQELVFADSLEEAYDSLVPYLYTVYGNKKTANAMANKIKKTWTVTSYEVASGPIRRC